MPKNATNNNNAPLNNHGNSDSHGCLDSRGIRQTFLRNRQRLLQMLAHLLEHTEPSSEPAVAATSAIVLNRFCDQLVDYLSQGHFRVFGAKGPDKSPQLLAETTIELVNFTDRHGNLDNQVSTSIRRELNLVALTLEARFEVEDLLLQLLERRTAAIPATAPATAPATGPAQTQGLFDPLLNDASVAYAN